VPKFHVEAEFSLYTTIEYDGYGDIGDIGDSGEADNYEDNSYFSSTEVECSGGNVTFTVEAEDEIDAERKASDVVSDGHEVEDRNGLTWAVQDVSFTITADEMTRDEAFVIVRRLLDRLVTENHITSEEREALDLVIQDS
jgi:hypothetical protein